MERASKCNLCSEEFISRSEFNHHLAREHGKPAGTPKKILICTICDHAFGRNAALIKHMRRHTGERPFKCTVDDCGTAFKQPSALNNHIKRKHSDERPLKCRFPACTYTAKTSANLTSHSNVHSDDRPFACSECDYKTIWKNALKSHRIRQHSARRDFKCSYPQCTKSLKSSVDLKNHFSNQHEGRNLQCDRPGCGKKCANVIALKKHQRDVHSTKSLVCSNIDCSYRTNTKGNLASHMKVHVARNEKISCSIEDCKYKAKNDRALEKHMRRHKTLLPCLESGCGHFAPTKEALKNHVKLHNSSERPFQCPLCSKYYQTLHDLQQHCYAHTNEKPFACGHCEYAAPFRSSIKTHISSAHANVKFPFIVHLLDDRECRHCNVILPTAEFLVHCKGHVDPVVMEA